MEYAPTPGLIIEDSARRLGALRWVELALHRTLGSWVQGIDEPRLKLVVAELSEHHAWHAELLAARIPNVRAISPATQTVPSVGAEALIAAFDSAASEPAAVRYAAYVRCVLPQLIEAYDTLRKDASPVSDAPALRTIGIIRRDLVDDLAAESARVFGVLGSEDEISRTGVFTHRLEMLRHETGVVSPR